MTLSSLFDKQGLTNSGHGRVIGNSESGSTAGSGHPDRRQASPVRVRGVRLAAVLQRGHARRDARGSQDQAEAGSA